MGLEPTDVVSRSRSFRPLKFKRKISESWSSTINGTLGDARLPESELSEAFEVWWPKLEERLAGIGETQTLESPVRNDRELLEEILEHSPNSGQPESVHSGNSWVENRGDPSDQSPEDDDFKANLCR